MISAVVDHWVKFAEKRLPAAHAFTREELADHSKVLLLAIASDGLSARSVGISRAPYGHA
jgi:hypothetical protein